MVSIKIFAYIALLAVGSYLSYQATRRRTRVFETVAARLSLTASKRGFSGELDGRHFAMRRIGIGRGRRRRYSLRFTLGVRSAPLDMRLATEGVASTLGKLVGHHDLRVGEDEFDREFLIQAEYDSPTLTWLNSTRRDALMTLHSIVDDVEIEHDALSFELPADFADEESILAAVAFARNAARIIDSGDEEGEKLLAPELVGVRQKRSKWDPVFQIIPLVIVVAGVLGAVGWVYFSLKPFTEERREQRAMRNAERGSTLEECLQGLRLTWDVDLSECEEAAVDVDRQTHSGKRAVSKLSAVQLRKATRVDLDREAARMAVDGVMSDVGQREYDEIRSRLLRDAGLLADYADTEDWNNPAIEGALWVSVIEDVPFDRGVFDSRTRALALRCLDGRADDAFIGVNHPNWPEIALACSATRPQRVNRPPWPRSGEAMLADLEADVERALPRYDQRSRGSQADPSPESDLYAAAVRLARGETVPETRLQEIEPLLEPHVCQGAWVPEMSYGDPEIWQKAAPKAGGLRDHMLTLAFAQAKQMRRPEVVESAPADLAPTAVLCKAQLKVATRDPNSAIETLDSVNPPEDLQPFFDYARAQAHFVEKEWKEAARLAVRSADSVPPRVEWNAVREGALLFAVAAQSQARDPEVGRMLEDLVGPAPAFDDLGDAVSYVQWLASPGEKAARRWEAPDSVPLVPGAELATLFVAGELADDVGREYWLDVLLPYDFDPYGVAEARLLAAKMRGDEAGIERWEKVNARLARHTSTPSGARLRGLLFR